MQIAFTETPNLEKLSEFEEECHITLEEYSAAVKLGMFTDYDGYGELATETHVSDLIVNPSELNISEFPTWATHVVWYNK